jgi:AcrR family transcriptional regulator
MTRATRSRAGETPARDPRREILAAASALLSEGGAEGLTIRRLALRSGYTSPAIYQEFGDKGGLLDAILQRAVEGLVERIERLPAPPEPRERLRLQFKEIVRFGREHPTNYRLMEALRPEQVLAIPSAEATRQRLEEPLEGMTGTGELAVADVETFRQALWALLHGLISLPAVRPDVVWRDRLEDVAFDAMLAGLLRPDGSRRGSR